MILISSPAFGRGPISASKLALIKESSFQRSIGSALPRPVFQSQPDGLGLLLTGIFEQQVRFPVVGTVILRPGQGIPFAADATPRERLIQSGRIWEKILNGFERWSNVYQSSVQIVKFFD